MEDFFFSLKNVLGLTSLALSDGILSVEFFDESFIISLQLGHVCIFSSSFNFELLYLTIFLPIEIIQTIYHFLNLQFSFLCLQCFKFFFLFSFLDIILHEFLILSLIF